MINFHLKVVQSIHWNIGAAQKSWGGELLEGQYVVTSEKGDIKKPDEAHAAWDKKS